MQGTKMKKRMTIMVIALVIVFGGIVGFNLFKAFMMKRYFAHYQTPAVSVSSVVVKQQDWEPRLAAVGNFVAINGVDVNSEASGNVVKIHFDSGQFIDKDKPLIDIDDSPDQATLKFNQSELVLQQINSQRQKDLLKRGATSTSSVDESQAKLVQAQANVEKTEAVIRQKHLSAPFAGQLGIRQVNLGQYITPGQTTIVTLQSMDPLYLDFYLPEQLLKKLHLNQEITFTVEQNPTLVFAGKISAINSKVDINTHNIQVQATIPNCPTDALTDPSHSPLVKVKKLPDIQKLLVYCDSTVNAKNKVEKFNFIPGMFSAIEIEQPVIKNIVVLPTTAISYSLYGNSVFIIQKDGQKDDNDQDILTVKRSFITTGDQQGNYTTITSGVKPGELVIGSGELKLQDGTRVTINNDVQLKDTVDIDKLGE